MFDFQSLLKYLLEGSAVAVVSYVLPKKTFTINETILIALTAAAVFAILDQFAPVVSLSTRQGTGFAIGYQQIGLGNMAEGYQNNDLSSQGVCQMRGNVCTYGPDTNDKQKAHFLCQNRNGQCTPTIACKTNNTGGCEWGNEEVNELPDAVGRTCTMGDEINVKKTCRLTKGPAPSPPVVEGFEGFNKVF